MKALTAFACALVMCSATSAAELQPIAAQSIHMANVNGIAYYTVESDGFRVVTTLIIGEQGQPVRYVATLLPGQNTTISVPREIGQSELTLQVRRVNDSVFVGDVKTARIDQ